MAGDCPLPAILLPTPGQFFADFDSPAVTLRVSQAGEPLVRVSGDFRLVLRNEKNESALKICAPAAS